MTKITGVRTKVVSHEFGKGYVETGVEYALVKISTDEGTTGTGFVPNVYRINGAGFADLYATFMERVLGALIVGKDPTAVEALWDEMFQRTTRWGRRGFVIHAIGAVDIALWDIIGKVLRKPLWKIMGGFRDKVPAYANEGHLLPPEPLAKKASEYVAQGFDAIKIRGTLPFVSPEEATQRISKVREAIGPDVKLMIDLNGSYTTELALRMIKKWEKYDLFWVEEPVHPDNIEGYREIKRKTSLPIAAGEQHCTVYDFKQLIESGLVDVVQPDVVFVGGITEWLRVWSLASTYNLPVSPHLVPFVSAQLVGAKPNTLWIEHAPPDNPLGEFIFDLFDEPRSVLYPQNGVVKLAEEPGLGIEIKSNYDF